MKSVQWFIEYIQCVFSFAVLRLNMYEFDWTFVAKTLKWSLSRLRKCMENGICEGSFQKSKDIKMCELLLERILGEDYETPESERQDMHLLCKTLENNLKYWWD